ncbi:MAG: transposase [Desulfofustis sp.]|jgi:putative transposase
MPRKARIVIPGIPHHITQRGNRRQNTFFSATDYHIYMRFMAIWCEKRKVEIWCYCLMPNHIHLIALPEMEYSLSRAIGEAHRRYTLYVNEKKDWKGYLWQGRFSSFPMDESHLLATARYIELNPVRSGLVKTPSEYPWSSCKAHLSGEDDLLVKTKPLLNLVPEWKELLYQGISEKEVETIKTHEKTGRPLGNERFIEKVELLRGAP